MIHESVQVKPMLEERQPKLESVLGVKRKMEEYDSSPFGRILLEAPHFDETNKKDRLHNQFRRRFGLPYSLFQTILQFLKDSGKFDYEIADESETKSLSLEIKLMGALKVLGRGATFDDIAELTGTSSEEIHRVFFHEFCDFMSQESNMNEFVYHPVVEKEKAYFEFRARLKQYTESKTTN